MAQLEHGSENEKDPENVRFEIFDVDNSHGFCCISNIIHCVQYCTIYA